MIQTIMMTTIIDSDHHIDRPYPNAA